MRSRCAQSAAPPGTATGATRCPACAPSSPRATPGRRTGSRIFRIRSCLKKAGPVRRPGTATERPMRLLNPFGGDIDLPFWVFRRLKKLHLLERDRDTGQRRIRAHVFGLMELREAPEFRPRTLRAMPPDRLPTQAKTRDW